MDVARLPTNLGSRRSSDFQEDVRVHASPPAGHLIRPDDLLGHLGVQDRRQVPTPLLVQCQLQAALSSDPTFPLPRPGVELTVGAARHRGTVPRGCRPLRPEASNDVSASNWSFSGDCRAQITSSVCCRYPSSERDTLMSSAALVTIVLSGLPDMDADELDNLTADLRKALLELDVDAVAPITTNEPPIGAKPAEAFTVGALAITTSPVLIASVVRLIETWIKNRPLRKLTLTIGDDHLEINQASRGEQRLVVESFIAEHSGK